MMRSARFLSRVPAGDLAAAGVLLLLLYVAYAPVLGGSFLNWDDDRFFLENPLWQGPVWGYVRACFARVQFQAYHPLHLSYLPDRWWWPAYAPGFHWLNLLLFWADLVLLQVLVRRRASGTWAWAVVALVALHPLAVEPVAWITARKDLLALWFVMAALWIEDRAPESQRFSFVTLALTVLANLAKSSAIVLPLLVFAWNLWARQRSWRASLIRALPPLVPALILAVFVPRLWAENQMLQPARPLSVWLDVPGTLAVYAARVLWPMGLSPVYPEVSALQIPGAVLWWCGAGAAAIWWPRLPRPARFALVGFFGSLLPVANLFPLTFRFADRYAAIALCTLAWPCARLLQTWEPRAGKAVLAGGLALLAAAEAAVTRADARSWHDSHALWSRAVRVQPRAFYGHLKLAETERVLGNWSAATASYVESIKVDPGSALGYSGLFATLSQRAERAGQIPGGRSAEWLRQLGVAVRSPRDLARLTAAVEAAGCAPCSYSLLWLGLRLYPPGDASLIAQARVSLTRGRPEEAVVYLLSVEKRSVPGFAELYQQVRARGRYPFQ